MFDIIAPIGISNKIVYLKHEYIDAIEIFNVKPNQFIIKATSKLYLSNNVKFIEKIQKILRQIWS